MFYTKVHVVARVNTCDSFFFFLICIVSRPSEHSEGDFQLPGEERNLSRRLQPKRLCKYSISRRSALRSHYQEAAKDSWAQKWLLNNTYIVYIITILDQSPWHGRWWYTVVCVSVECVQVLFQSLNLAAMFVRKHLSCAINNAKWTYYFIQRVLV